MKPKSAGISHLIIRQSDHPEGTVLHNPKDIEASLMKHCQEHFKKAHGSPFTVAPLSMLLGYDALTAFGQQVLDGNAPINNLSINHATALLLKHLHYATPTPGPHYQDMPFDKMMQGFCKWPKCTSTSLLGRHLGIYESLLKDVYKSKKTPKKQQSNEIASSPSAAYDGSNVMQMNHTLLQLYILHCHTFDWWRVVWNLFLEKDIGNPRIN